MSSSGRAAEDVDAGGKNAERERSTLTERSFRSVTLTPQRVQAEVEGTRLGDEEFTERVLFLTETAAGVTIATEGSGGGKTGGSLVELDTDQARRLGDALHLAADQLEETADASGGSNE